ncbi:MAG: glucose-6-phosphate isomerase, partial [Bacillota bacterium]
MVNIDLTGCDSFVKKEQFNEYVNKALAAQKVLQEESGAGNDFLGWQHLPSSIGKAELDDCLSVVDRWLEREIDLVVVIGIGGSYLGAKAAIEALSHTFACQLGSHGPKVV